MHRTRLFKAVRGIDAVSVTYEFDLLDSSLHQTTAYRVFDYLEVSRERVKVAVYRQGTGRLQEDVENIDEILHVLSNTPFDTYVPEGWA